MARAVLVARHVPGAPLPDGSFALQRAGGGDVDRAADGVGSRTLWCVMLDRELIAATARTGGCA